MEVNLTKKGQKVDLTKTNPGLERVEVGLGWDTNKYHGDHDFDLDASIFLLTSEGKVRELKDMVYYGNKEVPGVFHTGDNRTGEGEGDDESIIVTLNEIPTDIERLVVAVTIYEAEERGQTFGQVSNAYIRVVDPSKGEELIRFDLEEDFSIETAIVAAELYRHQGEWKFSAVGSGYTGGLAALCGEYGLGVK